MASGLHHDAMAEEDEGAAATSNHRPLSSLNDDHRSGGGDGIPTSSGPEADKFERFEAWLLANGAQFDMLELREYETEGTTSVCGGDDVRGSKSREKDSSAEEKKEPSKEGLDEDDEEDDDAKDGAAGGGGGSGEMRGVHARVAVPPNTVCVSVPRRCLITVEMGQSTSVGKAILDSDLDLDAPKHIFLMVYLLWDRKVNGRKSFFRPYYDILPKTLRNMPIFWNESELRELRGSYLLDQIADRSEAIADDYRSICDVAPELSDIASLDEFKWARMCVCSRNFGLQIDGRRTSALVPHADMLNHLRPRETKWTFDDERQCFTITTLQTIPAGAQVYDSYGQKCNHRFLLNYGFAVEDNRELDGFCPNEVPIELWVSPDDPLYGPKQEFWTRGEGGGSGGGVGSASSALGPEVAAAVARARQQGKGGAGAAAVAAAVEVALGRADAAVGGANAAAPPSTPQAVKRVRVCASNNENTRILFSMLRVLACDESELRTISTAPSSSVHHHDGGSVGRAFLGFAGAHHAGAMSAAASAAFYRTCRDVRHPLNIRNERAAMRLLLDVIGRALSKYPTTLQEDVSDLSDLSDESAYPRFSNRRHAKIQVRGEKEVLHHFADWAQTSLEVLDVIEAELAEEERGCDGGGNNGDGERGRGGGGGGGTDGDGGPAAAALSGGGGGFDAIAREMEEEEGMPGRLGRHHTIVRHCVDVLGALRREETKKLRRAMNSLEFE